MYRTVAQLDSLSNLLATGSRGTSPASPCPRHRCRAALSSR